jgi:hypothetical protein
MPSDKVDQEHENQIGIKNQASALLEKQACDALGRGVAFYLAPNRNAKGPLAVASGPRWHYADFAVDELGPPRDR